MIVDPLAPLLRLITTYGPPIVVAASVVGVTVKALQFIGKRVSTFVDNKVVPPVKELTASMNNMSDKIHEVGETFQRFADRQSEINEHFDTRINNTAIKLAEVRGHLGLPHHEE